MISSNVSSNVPSCLSNVIAEAYEGGGMLGNCYTPIIESFDLWQLPIIHHSGTSAGALTAMLRSLGYSSARISQLQTETNWKGWATYRPSGVVRLVKDRGWFPIDSARKWIVARIEEAGFDKTLTFKQLLDARGHSLYVVATRWEVWENHQGASAAVFNPYTTPDILVAEAVLASMAVPIYWPLVCVNGYWYSDGGVVMNHPVHVFNNVGLDQIIGVRLDTGAEIHRDEGKIKDSDIQAVKPTLAQVITGTIGLMQSSANKMYISEELWGRIIRVDVTGEKSLDFRGGKEKVERLRKAGEKALREWVAGKEQIK